MKSTMSIRLRRVVAQCLGLLALTPMVLAPAAAQDAAAAAAGELAALQARGVQVERSARTGQVSFIGGTPQARTVAPAPAGAADTAARSRAHLNAHAAHFGIADAARELRPVRQTVSPHGTRVARFQQTTGGVPIFGATLVVDTDADGALLAIAGKALPTRKLVTLPSLPATTAVETALAATAKAHRLQPGELTASAPELWVLDPTLLGLERALRQPVLTWRINVRPATSPRPGARAIDQLVFVDAQNGRVRLQFNQRPHARQRSTFDSLSSANRGVPVCTETDVGCSNGANPEADLAHLFAGDAYDFYFNLFGRDSYDGLGAPLISSVHYCEDATCAGNAFWDGAAGQMFYTAGFVTDDVAAHELTHAVTDSESQLIYFAESGAINEHLSDVFGELVDLTNGRGNDTAAVRWQIGEDLPAIVGVLRNMKDPTLFGDPDRRLSPNFKLNIDDSYGVHSNSGVGNKAAFLIADGGTFNGRTVTGLGLEKMARLFYEAQVSLLQPASTYEDLAHALRQACVNLTGLHGFTAADCTQVLNATEATEMTRVPAAAAALCPAGQTPLVLGEHSNFSFTPSGSLNVISLDPEWAVDDVQYRSTPNSMWGQSQAFANDARLTYEIGGTLNASDRLVFFHAYDLEYELSDNVTGYDGGLIEYSINGGLTWTDANALIAAGLRYNRTISSGFGSPIAGRRAFSGSVGGTFWNTIVNLGTLAGRQNLQWRFRVVSDESVSVIGWNIDDIAHYRCISAGTPSLSLSAKTYTVTEGGPTLSVLVNRGGTGTGAVTVNWHTLPGSAVVGQDFGPAGNSIPPAGTLSWGVGDMAPKAITLGNAFTTIPIPDDAVAEGPKTFNIVLSEPSEGAVIGANSVATVTIVDNDSAISFAAAAVSVGEAGPNQLLTLTRTGSTATAASVTWTTANGSAVAGSDFGAAGQALQRTGTVTWAAGDGAPKTIAVGPVTAAGTWIPVINDTAVEGPEAFTVGLSGPTGGATIGPIGTATVNIVDDDSVVSFVAGDLAVGEAGPNGQLSVSRIGSIASAASVTWTTANGSALAGQDFGTSGVATQRSGTLTWAAGDGTPKLITVGPAAAAGAWIPVVNDTTPEAPETFTVRLSAPTGGAQLGATPVATVTVVSEDAGLALAAPALTVGEGAVEALLVVQRVGPVGGAAIVNFATANGTALAGQHYGAVSGVLSWAAGDGTSRTISVPIIDNAVNNAARTFTFRLSGAVGAALGVASTTVTIADDDNTLQFAPAAVSVSEGAGSVTLTVTRVGAATAAASVLWNTFDVTAQGGLDYGVPAVPAPHSGTLSWAAGDATPKTLTLPILPDALVEGNETFIVMLVGVSGSGARVGAASTATVTILDDEAGLAMGSASVDVLESGPLVSVAVQRSGPATAPAQVAWRTVNGTALAGTDFGTAGNPAPRSGVLNWAAGDTAPKLITVGPGAMVPVLNNATPQADRSFTLLIENPVGAALGTRTATTVQVLDDDSVIEWGTPALGVAENGANGTLTVTRSGSANTAASVTWTTFNGSALAPTDYSTRTGTLTWTVGETGPKTIAVGSQAAAGAWIPVINDTLVEPAKAFTVNLSAPTGGALLGAAKTATVTITSDDNTLALASATAATSEGAGTVVLQVLRNGNLAAPASVNFSTANGTALAGQHYTLTTGTLNWPAGDGLPRTITVPLIDDAVTNAARSFTVNLSSPSGAALGTPATTTVTLADNDSFVQFASPTATVTEGTAAVTLTVTRSGVLGAPVTVGWATGNVSAQAGADFGVLGQASAPSGTLSWAAGDGSPRTITIPILDDAAVEGTETFIVGLSPVSGTGLHIGANGTATVTLLDNETSIGFAAASTTQLESAALKTITVQRSGPAAGAASVTWTTASGTALAGQDFGTLGSDAQRTGVLNWVSGDATPKTITIGPGAMVPILNDTTDRGARNFTIVLSNPVGVAALATQAVHTVQITDDDSTLGFAVATLAATEAGPNVALSVTRTGALNTAASVTWTTVNGSALAGTDFGTAGAATQRSGVLTWAVGDGAPKTITVGSQVATGAWIPIVNDSVVEPEKVFSVVLSAPTGGARIAAGSGSASVAITSEDSGIAMAVAAQPVAEGAGSVTVTMQRLGPAGGQVSANYATANGTAIAGQHYESRSGVVTWPPGDNAPRQVVIPIIDNGTSNTPRSFSFTLSNAVGGTIGSPATTTVTINDDDNSVQFTGTTASIAENAGVLTLSVTRTGITTQAASVQWQAVSLSAVVGQDLGVLGIPTLAGTLNWAPGDALPKAITIPILDDALVEGNETFTVLLGSPSGTGTRLGTNLATTVTILDNESGICPATGSLQVAEAGPMVTLSVQRTGPATTAASVAWTTVGGTAVAGQDYGTAANPAERSGTLTWAAGDAAPKLITIGPAAMVPVLNDTLVEAAESFQILLSNPTGGATLCAGNVVTVGITDDDSVVGFELASIDTAETGANTQLVVQRVGSLNTAASVTWTTANGTATAGSDFGSTGVASQRSGTLTWAAGDGAPKLIQVGPTTATGAWIPVLNDTAVEAPETFTVVLSAATGGARIGTGTATVTILSDEAGVGMAQPSLSVAEAAGTLNVPVRRIGSAAAPACVNYTMVNGTALSGQHYSGASGQLCWAAGDASPQNIVVPILDNGLTNAARTFSVQLSAPTGGTLSAPTSTAVTILDDDSTLQFSAAAVTVSEAAASVSLSVTRTGGTAGPASLNWSTVNGTATAGQDFGFVLPVQVTGTLNWAAGDGAAKTITIPLLPDGLVEGSETFVVQITGVGGTGTSIGAVGQATVTITDNDSVVALSTAALAVKEAGPNVALTVTRSGALDSAASVTWTTATEAGDTATAGIDYAVRSGTLNWAAGDGAPKTLLVGSQAGAAIPVTADGLAEPNETFTVKLLSAGGNAVLGGTVASTVTIRPPNTAPVAFAGSPQSVGIGSLVTLDGSGSGDADGDALTYQWTLTSRPVGSTATLSGATTVSPSFTPDVVGTYTLSLVVRDGIVNSAPSTVTVTAALASFNGVWTGTTGQGRSISFTVTNNRITPINLSFSALGCGATGSSTTNFTTGLEILSGHVGFSTVGNNLIAFSGNFTSPNQASGNLTYRYDSGFPFFCVTTFSTTWTATKP